MTKEVRVSSGLFGERQRVMMLVLHVTLKGRVVKSYGLSGDVVRIGRDPDSEVVLDHPGISRAHAVIEHKNGAFLLRDCGSSNKTYHNGRPCSYAVLTQGDLLQVGRYLVRVGITSGEEEPLRGRQMYDYPTVRMGGLQVELPHSPI
jgi:pSer/pThr/pTyr-binding forkhead associated (FHA) protein